MRRACALSLAPLWALLGTSCQEQAGKCSNHTENLCLQFELADHGTMADAIKLTVSSAAQNRTFDFPNIAQLAARPYVVEIAFDTSAPAAVDLDAVASSSNSAAGAGVRPVAAAKLTMLAPATAARPTRIVLQSVAGNDLGLPTGDLQGGTPTDGGTPADFTPTAWKMVYGNAGTPLNALFGISGTTKIYAAGNNGLVVSGDGNSFTPTAAAAGTGTLSGIWVASATAAFACDKQGTAFRTVDGGATWTPNTTAGFALSAISGRSATDVLAVGSNITMALYWNGSSWSKASHNLGATFSGVFASSNYYYAIGTSGLGGRAPTPQTVWNALTNGAADAQWAMAGLGTTDSFTVAVSTTGTVQYVTGTTTTWTSMPQPGNSLYAVWVPAAMSPVVGGLGGTVYQYASGTWNSLGNVGAGYNITGLWGDSSGTLWATASNGAGGAIFKR